MRRGEAVYFFTLVDFLLTALFFGFVLSVASQSSAEQQAAAVKADSQQVATLTRLAGVSDLAQLTDELTRLVPLRDAHSAVALIRQLGGPDQARTLARMQGKAGGSDSLRAKLERMLAHDGAGRPHCLYNIDNAGNKTPIPVARIVATDRGIEFTDSAATLDRVLVELHVSFQDVRSLPFENFKRAFGPLREKPCAYTVRVREETNYKFAREALYGIFYTEFERQ